MVGRLNPAGGSWTGVGVTVAPGAVVGLGVGVAVTWGVGVEVAPGGGVGVTVGVEVGAGEPVDVGVGVREPVGVGVGVPVSSAISNSKVQAGTGVGSASGQQVLSVGQREL